MKVEFASPETAVVTLVGEHDLNSRLSLQATLMGAAEGRDLLVDLGQCTFADSAIVSLLLGTVRTLNGRNRRCELIIPPESGYVTRLFEITGIADLFRVHSVARGGAREHGGAPRARLGLAALDSTAWTPGEPDGLDSMAAWPGAPASDAASRRPSSTPCASARIAT